MFLGGELLAASNLSTLKRAQSQLAACNGPVKVAISLPSHKIARVCNSILLLDTMNASEGAR